MTEPTPQTVSQIDAQIAELKLQRDIASLASLKAVQAVLQRPSTGKVADDIEAVLADLPNGGEIGSARNQANNVISILRQVTAHFDREVTRVQTMVDAQATA